MDVFRECRERVSAEEAALLYGMDVKKHWTSCCFHHDRTPSLHFFRGGFKCFSCGAHGSCIDLTMKLFGLSPIEAVKRLDRDFGLGLDYGQQTDTEREYRRFCKWREGALDELDGAIRTRSVLGDATTVAALDEAFNVLLGEDLAAQMALYSRREEVTRLCQSLSSLPGC